MLKYILLNNESSEICSLIISANSNLIALLLVNIRSLGSGAICKNVSRISEDYESSTNLSRSDWLNKGDNSSYRNS